MEKTRQSEGETGSYRERQTERERQGDIGKDSQRERGGGNREVLGKSDKTVRGRDRETENVTDKGRQKNFGRDRDGMREVFASESK